MKEIDKLIGRLKNEIEIVDKEMEQYFKEFGF
jgi:hypothetical protein